MSELVDVLIVGGGVIGLSSAIAMAERNFSVLVLDAGALTVDDVAKSARVYAINGASKALLKRLGVWELLPKDALSPYQGMHVWDEANHLAKLEFCARDLASTELGFIIEEHELKTALLKRASVMDITLIPHARVSSCAEIEGGVHITTEDGQVRAAKLCMIADGANSSTRDLLKVPMTSWSYHHDALVATVETEKPHQKTAYQVFLKEGPLAFLPLQDEHQCSIVWSHPPERIKALKALDKQVFEAQLTQAFSEKLGCVSVVGERISFPLRMRHVKQYVGDNWLLLGDAAHTIHPLAGLGLNVGLADLKAWLDLVDKQGVWSKRTLQAYQRERKHAVWGIIALMQGIKTMFGLSFEPLSFMRGLGMRILNQTSSLKRMLMRYAAGD